MAHVSAQAGKSEIDECSVPLRLDVLEHFDGTSSLPQKVGEKLGSAVTFFPSLLTSRSSVSCGIRVIICVTRRSTMSTREA